MCEAARGMTVLLRNSVRCIYQGEVDQTMPPPSRYALLSTRWTSLSVWPKAAFAFCMPSPDADFMTMHGAIAPPSDGA